MTDRNAFQVGQGADSDWRAACEACLTGLDPAPAGANIGFVYFSDHFADLAGDILSLLRARLRIEAWSGTTGIGVCATGREYFDQPAVVHRRDCVGLPLCP